VVSEEVPKEIFQILQAIIIVTVACASVYLRRRARPPGAHA
jgi:hypothetical protein